MLELFKLSHFKVTNTKTATFIVKPVNWVHTM